LRKISSSQRFLPVGVRWGRVKLAHATVKHSEYSLPLMLPELKGGLVGEVIKKQEKNQ
jgi:hypothetical protein